MSEHVTAWIPAYHDGELHGGLRRRVESHLRDCAACRAELGMLQGLSALLQETPAMPARTAPERFVAQVRLRLAPRAAPPPRMRVLRAGWWLLPLVLMAAWAFLQAVLMVSSGVLIVLSSSGAMPGFESLVWYPAVLALDLGMTAVLAALVWGWLAGWWAVSRTNMNSSGAVSG